MITVTCDTVGCGTHFPLTDPKEWASLKLELEDSGWMVREEVNGMHFICPTCANSLRRPSYISAWLIEPSERFHKVRREWSTPGACPVEGAEHYVHHDLYSKAVKVLKGLQRGGCFCEMGIGNPNFRDHTPQCKAAQAVIADTAADNWTVLEDG